MISFETANTLRETIVSGDIKNMNISVHNAYKPDERTSYIFQFLVI